MKCTSNSRVKILDCAGILRPGVKVEVCLEGNREASGDKLFLVWTEVGRSWLHEDVNVYAAWARVKAQQVRGCGAAVVGGNED